MSFVAAGAAMLAFAPKAEAQLAPEYVQIADVDYGGTGCPAGSVASQISTDRRSLTLLFDEFVAQAAPGMEPGEARKSCDLSVLLDFPPGWSFTILTADYRGGFELEPRVVGTQLSSYFFAGSFGPSFRTRLEGPTDGNYVRRDTLGLEAAIWSPCERTAPLRIHTETRVSTLRNPSGSGFMTVDSADLVVRQTYGLVWRRCAQ
jgi:hypothetical protein